MCSVFEKREGNLDIFGDQWVNYRGYFKCLLVSTFSSPFPSLSCRLVDHVTDFWAI